MTTLFYVEPELVIALNNKIIFVNPNDLQIFKEIEVPQDLTKCGLKVAVEEGSNTTVSNIAQEVPVIQNARLSPTRELLAVTTSGQKALLLYKCYPVHAKLLSVRALARASSALAFSNDGQRLLVTDKTGDCWEYDCANVEAASRLLFAHLSIVYDVLWSADEQHIITCDRDDKIRVTNYPQTYDIHNYCLGHKEFVAGLALLPQQQHLLVSLSGDKTLRLWNYERGQSLAQCELPAPGIRLILRKLQQENHYQVAVLLHQPDECVGIYDIIQQKSEGEGFVWKICEKRLLNFPGLIASALCFVDERLYVVGMAEGRFKICVEAPSALPENWLSMVEEQFKDTQNWKLEDVADWFKKRYDNVSEYLERKKRRIEDKQN